jgi:hypothetical protein
MEKRPLILAGIAAAALVALFFAARKLPNSAAALPLASQQKVARIISASTTPVSINQGLLRLSVTGENVERYRVSASCPGKVSVEISGTDICGSAKNRTPDELEKQLVSVGNPENATGTATISVQVAEPKVPLAAWTRRNINVEILAK